MADLDSSVTESSLYEEIQTPLPKRERHHLSRDWVFVKIEHCVDAGKVKAGGALVVGGSGSGKTTLFRQLVTHDNQVSSVVQCKAQELRPRCVCVYFCDGQNVQTLSVSYFIKDIVRQLSKCDLLSGYRQKIEDSEIVACLEDNEIERQPDEAFKKAVLFPLLEMEAPPQPCLMVVDGLDEPAIYTERDRMSHSTHRTSHSIHGTLDTSTSSHSDSIVTLLSSNYQLFPQWLVLVASARRQSRTISRLFSGFRKIALDDLRKSHVIRDVQQYILNRLDSDINLRKHLSRENAEMLNQLHIKSNGCLLYLEHVLDGVVDGSIVLREIRDIPGTLNGLYLWFCQRTFASKTEFDTNIRPLLSLLLTATKPVPFEDVFQCLWGRDSDLTRDDLQKIIRRLEKIVVNNNGVLRIFHQSFSEWLCDVKHCTQRFLCKASVGHAIWALRYSTLCKATDLNTEELIDYWYHLCRSGLPSHYQAMWYSQSTGEPINDSIMFASVTSSINDNIMNNSIILETKAMKLLLDACGAPNLRRFKSNGHLDEFEDELTSVSELATSMVEDSQQMTIDIETLDQAEPISQRTLLHTAANDGDKALVMRLVDMDAQIEAVDRNGQTPLNLAARQGHVQVVEILLKAGADVDHADLDGWTPLRSSAWAGHSQVVNTLLDFGARVDLADADGRTALRAASWGGHDDIVLRLLKAGADVNAKDAEGRTALIAAAYMGHSAIVGHLLDNGADINHNDKDGRTALSVAALCVPASQGHHAQVVSFLLERGAHVDHKDSEGMTALLVAAFEGHTEVCELLLEGGADVDHADSTGRTPLFAAASMGHAHVVNRLLFWGAYVDSIDAEGRTVLSVAAAQGNPQTVEYLLDRGLDELHRDNAGWTALHYSAFEGHVHVCQLLMQAGAKASEVDTDGRTPLILAAQEGHSACVQLFVQSSPKILEHRSHDGRTALRMAAMEAHRETVDLLLSLGADVNYQDADGRSTLYLLALEGNAAMIDFLIQRGADVEITDLEGRTALHVAAWQGHTHVVDLLLKRGADVDRVDKEMRSALQSAAWQGHSEVVRLLLDRGSNVNHVCNQGASALGIAAQEGHIDVVKVLLSRGADVNHVDLCGRTPARVAVKAGHEDVAALIEAHGENSNGHASSSSGGNHSDHSALQHLQQINSNPPKVAPRSSFLFNQPANRSSLADSVTTGSDSGTGGKETPVNFTAMLQRRASQTSSSAHAAAARENKGQSQAGGGSFYNFRRTKIVTNPNFLGSSAKKKETPL